MGLFAVGLATSPTFARFSSQGAPNSNSFTTRKLLPPSNLAASPTGYTVPLSWSAGQQGNGYGVLGSANGTSSDCTNVTYAGIGSTTSLIYTDTNRHTPQGTWYCYKVQTTYGNWTSTQNNPTKAVQIGFVADSVVMTNGGTSGQLDGGDQIVITFNQAVDSNTGPSSGNTVCAEATSNTIWLGSTTTGGSGNCLTTETVTLGKITGGTITGAARFSATYTWGNANKTITVTLGTRTDGTGNPTVGSGSWSFNPVSDETKLKSSSGAFHICDSNADSGNCLPSTSSLP